MCVFCKIVNGEIPSYRLYEDEKVIVFLDVNPKSNGHALIVPKEHTLDIDTIDDDLLLHIMKVSRRIKKGLEETLKIDGLVYVQNNGEPQEVKHYHLHLIPFYKDNQELLDVKEVYEKMK